jgi:hypothetical protein
MTAAGEKGGQEGHEGHRIVFFIGKEKFEVTDEHLTVRVLLTQYAKEDPNETVLALKHGDHVHKYTNLDEVIEVKSGMHFTVFHTGPTTVS